MKKFMFTIEELLLREDRVTRTPRFNQNIRTRNVGPRVGCEKEFLSLVTEGHQEGDTN